MVSALLSLRITSLILILGLFNHCSSTNPNNNPSDRISMQGSPAAPVLDWLPAYTTTPTTPPTTFMPVGLTGSVLDFGAKCDGITDDREAIQNALDTLIVVLLPAKVTCVVYASRRSILFFGTAHRFALSVPSNRAFYLNGSILRLADGQNAHLFVNSNIESDGNHDIAILGPGTIDLNKAHQSNPATGEQSGGFMDQVTNLTLRDIVFTNVREYALRHFRVKGGYYDNLICTDSDGSCFAFGTSSIGGPNDCYFGHIEGHNAAGTSSAGAQGNPFISYGSHNTLMSFVGTANRFGFKIQDGASDWIIGTVQVDKTTSDKAVKIMGSSDGTHTQRIKVLEILTSENYYEGLYVWESEDIEIRRVNSKRDGLGISSSIMLAPSANGIAIHSISVQESKASGVSIEGTDVDIGEIYARNNGSQLSGQENVAIFSTGQRIRIGSLITVDDQRPSTVAYGLAIHSGARDVDVQSFLPLGSFVVNQLANGGVNIRIVDYEAIAKSFLDGDMTPSVAIGTLFKTANSRSTTINNFRDGTINQEISILCGDSHTVFSEIERLRLTAPMTCGSSNLIRFIFDGNNWLESTRTSL